MSALPARRPLLDRLGLGRPAVLLSLGLHVVIFIVTLGVPRLLASSPKAAPIYIVDLVSFGGGTAGPAAPPSAAPSAPAKSPPSAQPVPRPKKAPEKAIVIPDRGAKKTPPKVEKKPAPKPEPTVKPGEAPDKDNETETTAAATPADTQPAVAAPAAGASPTPGAPGGTPGGTGAGGEGTGVGGDAYNFYLALLDHSIKGAWKRPLYGGRDVLSATVRLEISRSGRVLRLDLVTSSGLDALDRSVLRAVRDAEPFPPLPTDLSLQTLPVQIVFELNPQAAGAGSPGE